MTPNVQTSVAQIAQALGLPFAGDGQRRINQLASLPDAQPDAISFVASAKYRLAAQESLAGALLIPQAWATEWQLHTAVLYSDDPYGDYARLTQWWKLQTHVEKVPERHPSAWIHPSAQVAEDADIGAFVVIQEGAVIESGVHIGAHSVIEAHARVGAQTRLAAHVVLGQRCTMGQRCVVHSGVVIGADGFGFAPVSTGGWNKIEQLGAVRIGNDCEIGANTCIDRGALNDTVLGNGVKLDNLVQIGHNVQIGDHVAMAGCVGVAGSAVIGDRCTVGGGAVVLGHLTLASDVHISAASVVTKSIHLPGQYSGVFPIDDNQSWEKNAATLRQLHNLRERLRVLERKIS